METEFENIKSPRIECRFLLRVVKRPHFSIFVFLARSKGFVIERRVTVSACKARMAKQGLEEEFTKQLTHFKREMNTTPPQG